MAAPQTEAYARLADSDALRDYNRQLTLLTLQNKKRLLLLRQESDRVPALNPTKVRRSSSERRPPRRELESSGLVNGRKRAEGRPAAPARGDGATQAMTGERERGEKALLEVRERQKPAMALDAVDNHADTKSAPENRANDPSKASQPQIDRDGGEAPSSLTPAVQQSRPSPETPWSKVTITLADEHTTTSIVFENEQNFQLPLCVNDRPFTCGQCPRGFDGDYDLDSHPRIHKAVMPFPCGRCARSFSPMQPLECNLPFHLIRVP